MSESTTPRADVVEGQAAPPPTQPTPEKTSRTGIRRIFSGSFGRNIGLVVALPGPDEDHVAGGRGVDGRLDLEELGPAARRADGQDAGGAERSEEEQSACRANKGCREHRRAFEVRAGVERRE